MFVEVSASDWSVCLQNKHFWTRILLVLSVRASPATLICGLRPCFLVLIRQYLVLPFLLAFAGFLIRRLFVISFVPFFQRSFVDVFSIAERIATILCLHQAAVITAIYLAQHLLFPYE